MRLRRGPCRGNSTVTARLTAIVKRTNTAIEAMTGCSSMYKRTKAPTRSRMLLCRSADIAAGRVVDEEGLGWSCSISRGSNAISTSRFLKQYVSREGIQKTELQILPIGVVARVILSTTMVESLGFFFKMLLLSLKKSTDCRFL